MKTQYKSIIYIALISLSLGCKKLVTDIPPQDRLSSDVSFSTPQRMENAVLGVYNALQSNNKDGYDNSYFLSGEALVIVDALGEDIVDIRTRLADIVNYNMFSTNATAAGIWTAGYTAISTANRVMAGVEANAKIVTPAKAKQFIAEAKFGRAIANFYLVNFFAQSYTIDPNGPGIPIITEAFTKNDPAANQPRSTVTQVYDQIIKDLKDALIDLPLAYTDAYSSKVRATQAAAAALLSRVYLYKQDYTNAKLYAGKLINGDYGIYALNPSPEQCFGPGNYETDESIFSIPNTSAGNDIPGANFGLERYNEGANNDLAVSPTFLNNVTNPYFTADDKRKTLLIVDYNDPNDAPLKYTVKYSDVANKSDWAPIIRYAEVLLNYAEASANLGVGVDADALIKLNMVRDRSRVAAPQYMAASFASKQAFIDAILGERRIELAFEGHRLWDLRRTGQKVMHKLEVDGTTPIATPLDTKYVLPIPDAEIRKSNGVLKQNVDY